MQVHKGLRAPAIEVEVTDVDRGVATVSWAGLRRRTTGPAAVVTLWLALTAAIPGVSTAETAGAHANTDTPSFTPVGSMTSERYHHTATLLSNGKVLIAGGGPNHPQYTALDTAELFDPATGTFTLLPPMTRTRLYHTATLLPNGQVLITGGAGGGATNTAELFDPASATFSPVANTMKLARYAHTATLLDNGEVLIAGGFTPVGATKAAELFDPATGTFTSLPTMTKERLRHTATVLPNGKVLLAGGVHTLATTNTVELFDPVTLTFRPPLQNTMSSDRAHHSATLLPSGAVLLAGGNADSNLGASTAKTAELFRDSLESFTPASDTMSLGRQGHTATLLPNGKVLVAGGSTGDGITTSENTDTAELYDLGSGTFTLLASTMSSRRNWHTASLLPDGRVLLAGGFGFAYRNTADLFDPASGTFTEAASTMSVARSSHTATVLRSGKVLIAGGRGPSGHTNAVDLFDPATGTFSSPAPMTVARMGHTATLLPDGKVLITGGREKDAVFGEPPLASAELFDPVTESFTSLPAMTSPRAEHTATLLPTGQVLLTGGDTGTRFSNAAELFDPAAGTFTALPGTMTSERYFHKATLLPSGQVLITGGGNMVQGMIGNSAELFDPATRTFTALPPMTAVRHFDTATLLSDGTVLITGGPGTPRGNANTAELFDAGLGFSDARRPVVSTAPDPLVQPGRLILTGTGFRGDSEGSGSSFASSATNFPLVQLMRVDGGQTFFPLSDPEASWSATGVTTETLGGDETPLPAGHYRVTVFANAIPSLHRMIYIDLPECHPEHLGGPPPHCDNG